ncbi:MAG: Ppx/GppA family phosphatase [Thermoguttaceae bacterium]|nr:Ppx/GppA family phosphatase [Thermoguttaceae bacterium]MDW8036776.1 Ppx/GppA phosphatase family protein [Thermoguttaceae bacterium]
MAQAPSAMTMSGGKACPVAAIDIGAHAVRMVVAQVFPDGRIEVLERFHRPVRLGQDTFSHGRLGSEAMRAALGVLRDFRNTLQLFQVQRVRAVATSAVREAMNADTFLDRIYLATGLNVEIIGPSEESRLTVSAVLHALGEQLDIRRDKTLIVEVGGGGTLLTVLEGGEIVVSESLRLGSIRIQELLNTTEEPPERSAELVRHHVANTLSMMEGTLNLQEVKIFIAVGGDARLAAKWAGRAEGAEGWWVIETPAFDKLVRRLQKLSPQQISRRHGIPFTQAEMLGPALLIYQILLHAADVPQMWVSPVSMRDGLLLELAREVTGQEDETVYRGVIHSTLAIAQKYRIDLEHAQQVAEMACRLFDQLKADHGLGARHRLLLRVAALLHEIGIFVSPQAYHKHSYYLVLNSEIFGLNRDEIVVVAHIARYHRRSGPKPTHLEYMSLPREKRVVVNKLAALLRVADALAGSHLQPIHLERIQREGDELIVWVAPGADLLLIRRSLAMVGDMLEDIYGLRVRVEES